MSQKKKFVITWTAHASEIIEADNINEAMEIARDADHPPLLDFSLPFHNNVEVEEYPGD